MTLRGTFHEGVIVPETVLGLRNGDVVEIVRSTGARGKAGKAKPASKALPGFGAWKHRTDLGDSAKAARTLRRRSSRGGG